MTETEKGWIAGIIDGEGCILIRKNIRPRNKKGIQHINYLLQITVTNKDIKVCYKLLRLCGGKIAINKQGSCKTFIYKWWILGSKASLLLENIMSLLTTKREEALLAIIFQSKKHPINAGQRKYTKEEYERNGHFFEKMKWLRQGKYNRKIVYVAGPYGKNTLPYEVIDNNIQKARKIGVKIWAIGLVAIVPHLNTAHFEQENKLNHIKHIDYLKGDLEIIGKCADSLFMVDGWENSNGAKAEKQFAEFIGIPVFYNMDDLRKWKNYEI